MWCSPTKAAAGEEKKKKSDDAGQEGVYIDDAFPLVYRDPYNSQKRKEEKPKQNRIGSVSKDCCQPSLPFFSLLFFLFFLRHCEIRMGDGRWDYAWQSGSIGLVVVVDTRERVPSALDLHSASLAMYYRDGGGFLCGVEDAGKLNHFDCLLPVHFLLRFPGI